MVYKDLVKNQDWETIHRINDLFEKERWKRRDEFSNEIDLSVDRWETTNKVNPEHFDRKISMNGDISWIQTTVQYQLKKDKFRNGYNCDFRNQLVKDTFHYDKFRLFWSGRDENDIDRKLKEWCPSFYDFYFSVPRKYRGYGFSMTRYFTDNHSMELRKQKREWEDKHTIPNWIKEVK